MLRSACFLFTWGKIGLLPLSAQEMKSSFFSFHWQKKQSHATCFYFVFHSYQLISKCEEIEEIGGRVFMPGNEKSITTNGECCTKYRRDFQKDLPASWSWWRRPVFWRMELCIYSGKEKKQSKVDSGEKKWDPDTPVRQKIKQTQPWSSLICGCYPHR